MYIRRSARLLVGDSSTPHAESECQLVDEIGNVVHDIDDALVMVGGGRSEKSQVVSQRVDAPTDGDDHSEGVESGLGSFVSGSSADLGALTSEHLVDEGQPEEDTRDETAEHGNNSRLTSVSAGQHEDGLSQQSVEETGAQVWKDSLQDEVELDDLQRNGDQPIGVSVDCWGLLSQHP